MDEAERDVETPAHAAGVRLHDPVGSVRDADELEQVADAPAQVVAAHALDTPLEHQVLAARAELVDAGVLRDVADRAADGARLAQHVVAADRRRARVGMRQRHEHAHGRRLAGAVRAEQPEHLALAHAERDAVQCLDVAVALAEIADGNRVHRRRD